MPRLKRSRKGYGKGKASKRARAGSKKRRPRKRTGRRPRGKENRMMAIPSATFTPTMTMKKFVYDLTIDLAPTTSGGLQANQFCQFVLSGNNINNPFVGAFLHPTVSPIYQGAGGSTPTGQKVKGFDRWIGGSSGQAQAQAPYQKYVVVGSKCSMNIVQTSKTQNTTTIGTQANVCPYILSTPPSAQAPATNYWGSSTTAPTINIDHLRAVRGCKSKNLCNVNGLTSNSQQTYISLGQSPKKVLGCHDLRDDDDAIGTAVSGPSKTTLFRCGIANRVYDDLAIHGMSGVLMRIRVEYNTLLYAPTAWTLNSTA